MYPHIVQTQSKDFLDQVIETFQTQFSIKPVATHHIHAEKSTISLDQIRALIQYVSHAQNQNHAYIFYDFDDTRAEVQNAMLKLLEESVSQNLFVLVVKNHQSILPTIRSRAKIMIDSTSPISQISNEVDTFEEKESILKTLSQTYSDKEEAVKILNAFLYKHREQLKQGSFDSAYTIKRILKSLRMLESNNLNPQLTVDRVQIETWFSF